MRATTRHNLKRDQFAAAVSDTAAGTFTWAQGHQNKVIVAAAVVVVALVVAAGGWWWNQRQTEQANVLLGRALRLQGAPLRPAGIPADPTMPSFTSVAERAQATRKAFGEVVEKYPRTAPGRLSRYFAAITFLDENNYSAAEKGLREAAEAGNKDVAALAKYALAQTYAAQHKDTEAVREYKELIDHPADMVSKSTAQLELAQLYEDRNQPSEAVRIYQQIQRDEPKTPAAEQAQSKLAGLARPK